MVVCLDSWNMLQREVRCLEDGTRCWHSGNLQIFFHNTSLQFQESEEFDLSWGTGQQLGVLSFPVMSLGGTFSLLNSRSAPIGSLSSVCLDWDACPSCCNPLSHISSCQMLWFYCCFFATLVCVCGWAFFCFLKVASSRISCWRERQ